MLVSSGARSAVSPADESTTRRQTTARRSETSQNPTHSSNTCQSTQPHYTTSSSSNTSWHGNGGNQAASLQAAPLRVTLSISTAGHVPLKVTLPVGRCRPPSNTWFLGPSKVHNRMVSWLVELFPQGPWSWLTDKQTDYRPYYSACSNKSHILMLCGLTMTTTTRRPSHCQVNCDMPEAQDLIIYGYHNQPLKL